MFAKKMDYSISNLKSLAEIANRIINKQIVQVVTYPSIVDELKSFDGYSDGCIRFFAPDDLEMLDSKIPTLYITPQRLANNSLQLHPKGLVLGLGMNRGTKAKEIELVVKRFCFEHSLKFEDVTTLASFEAKADEIGLLEFAKDSNKELKFFNKDEINLLEEDFSPSQATKFFNIKGVAEPASLLASRTKTLFLSKRIYGNVTIACSF
jgi:cobalt-precorrin 5A hydrolase